ncbi:lipopolysaccharide transport periplasmic protein LptA [Roseovarius sp. MBR-154]|jgi:lipopolysaccharide export system protein LptA
MAGIVMACLPLSAAAQGAQVAFGSSPGDRDLPIEVTSDSLDVNQNDNTAVFAGSVVIAQGAMRIAAPRVLVVYSSDSRSIDRIEATGGVTLVDGADAAEAARADYNIVTGMIELRGDVLVVQGADAVAGDAMFVDTEAGTARVVGRVKTLLQAETRE